MIQTTSIREIIREAPDHVEPKAGHEANVVINTDTGLAVDEVGFIESFIGNFKYFLVLNNSNPQKAITGRKPIKYREGTEEVVFAIDYNGGCPRGCEMQLAEFFYRTPDPDKAISDALGKWLIEYFSAGGRKIDHFFTEQDRAARELASNAQREFGLALTIKLSVDNAAQLDTLEVGPLVISSRLLGSDEEEKLSIKAELEVDPQNLLRAMLSPTPSLSDQLKKGVKKYLATRVTLQTYYDDLNSDNIKHGLRDHLNGLLKQFGRRVTFVSLKPEITNGPPPYNGETVIEYKHHESTEPVKLKISVLMIPHDAARYRAKGWPPLSSWLQSNLAEAVKLSLFGVSYIDLLLDFSGPKQKIINEMNRRADVIGYKIEQLMTMLWMEPLLWRKRIDIEIKNTESSPTEAMFATSVSGVYVGLEIFLTARVKNLRAVSSFLNTNLPQKMKEEISRLVEKTIHATDPQDFYKHYREADKKKHPNGAGFEIEIRQQICHLLESEFHAEIIHLVLKPTETDLTTKVHEVARTSHDFIAETEIGTDPGAPKISVQGSFTVEGVNPDGWEQFRERDVSSAKLTKRVADAVSAFIKSSSPSGAALSSPDAVVELIKHALQAARGLIQDEFGLSIKLTTISWDWDEQIKKIGELRNAEDLAAVQERISELKTRLLDLYEYDGSQAEIDSVRTSIKRLSAMVPSSLKSSVGFRELPEPPAFKNLPSAEVDAHNISEKTS